MKLENDEDIPQFFKETVEKENGPIAKGNIIWHMMTEEEVESLLEFVRSNKTMTKDHRVIVISQENSIAGVVKVASPDEFFKETGNTRVDYLLSKFPECAKDITDYGSW